MLTPNWSMHPKSKAYLWDAQQAALAVSSFTAGIEKNDFMQSLLLRSAVERQLEILGEALNRVRKLDPDTADLVPKIHQIIATRNFIVHEYGAVDYEIVWEVATRRMNSLAILLGRLLAEG